MTFRRLLVLGALASCSLLAAGVDARADYTYSTSVVTATPADPAGLGQQITSMSSTISPTAPAQPAVVHISYAPTTTLGPLTQTLTWTETLNNLPGGPSQVFSITGTLNILSASTGGVTASFTNVTITPMSGAGFTLSLVTYAPTNTDGTQANIGLVIQPTAIPEPTSMALLGTGLVGVVGLGLRRSRTKTKV